jgi:hypothetical protein
METPPPAPETRPAPKPPRRGPPLVLLGGLGALIAGGAIAWTLVAGDRASAPPPASEGGLVIDSSTAEDGRMDPGKPLRCFVQGQFVGEFSLSDCARRNGVATDALDVGLDETGALAAAQEAGAQLIPLPPPEEGTQPATEDSSPPPAEAEETAPEAASATCWRHGGGRWRRMPEAGDLNACVQTLFAGRCERPGGAAYGRFGTQTLRLVAGKVEISDDNRSFRTLAPQAPDCSLPPVG